MRKGKRILNRALTQLLVSCGDNQSKHGGDRDGANWEDLECISVTEPSELSDGLDPGNEKDGKFQANSQLGHLDSWTDSDGNY